MCLYYFTFLWGDADVFLAWSGIAFSVLWSCFRPWPTPTTLEIFPATEPNSQASGVISGWKCEAERTAHLTIIYDEDDARLAGPDSLGVRDRAYRCS